MRSGSLSLRDCVRAGTLTGDDGEAVLRSCEDSEPELEGRSLSEPALEDRWPTGSATSGRGAALLPPDRRNGRAEVAGLLVLPPWMAGRAPRDVGESALPASLPIAGAAQPAAPLPPVRRLKSMTGKIQKKRIGGFGDYC